MTTEMKKRRARKKHYLQMVCNYGFKGCWGIGVHMHDKRPLLIGDDEK